MHFIAPINPPPPPPAPKFFSLNNVLASGSSIIEHDFVTFCALQWNLSQWLFDIRLCLRWWPSQRKNCRGINSLYVFARAEWGGGGFSLCVSRFLLKFFFFLHFYYLKKKNALGLGYFAPFKLWQKLPFPSCLLWNLSMWNPIPFFPYSWGITVTDTGNLKLVNTYHWQWVGQLGYYWKNYELEKFESGACGWKV